MPQKRPQDLANAVALFKRQYERKAQRGLEPNDRGYDRSLENRLKRLKPEELSALMSQAHIESTHGEQEDNRENQND